MTVKVRRPTLGDVTAALESKAARRAELEGLIVELVAAEHQAVADALAAAPDAEPYFKGRVAWAKREERRKNEQRIRDLGVEITALSQQKESLTANLSVERLDEAIKTVTPLHGEMEAAVSEAAELVAQVIRGPWRTYRQAQDELVTLTQRGDGIAGEAAAIEENAQARWAQATSSPFDGSVATNPAWLIEVVLSAMFDPDGDNSSGFGNTNARLRELVPDLRNESGLYANKGRMAAFFRTTPMAQHMDTGLRRVLDNKTVVEEPSPEMSEVEARRIVEAAAEHQRRFERMKPDHEKAATRMALGLAEAARQSPHQRDRGGLDEPLTDAELRTFDLEDGD